MNVQNIHFFTLKIEEKRKLKNKKINKKVELKR